jgi:hypothetical protein
MVKYRDGFYSTGCMAVLSSASGAAHTDFTDESADNVRNEGSEDEMLSLSTRRQSSHRRMRSDAPLKVVLQEYL